MRRILTASTLALLALGASVQAGWLCCNPHCPDCSPPCDHRLNLILFGGHAAQYCADLSSGDLCTRVKAAKKLGYRLHADFCQDPGVLDTLIGALLCDASWEVRREAAWSIFLQDARTDQGVLALYISSKLDPERRVRLRASEALEFLTVCRTDCYKGLYAS